MGQDARLKLIRDMLGAMDNVEDAHFFIKEYADKLPDQNVVLNIQTNILTTDIDVTPRARAELVALWDTIGLESTRSGAPIINENNLLKIFAYDEVFRDCIHYDQFQRCVLLKDMKTMKFRRFADGDAVTILVNLQNHYGLTALGLSTVNNAITAFAQINKKDELAEYLAGVVWDGVERVNKFFIDYCGSKDTGIGRAVSSNFWIGMVARGLVPGCKVDNMVILEGKQGLKKSTLLGVIGGRWYAENTAEIGDKDFYQNLEGVLIAEIAELDSFSKAGVTTIKRVVTSVQDKYRPSYGRHSVVFKRRNIFVGTTNEREYLKDETGNRRFWPIKCRSIDLDAVARDRDLLFAEAVSLFRRGVKWYEVPQEAVAIQESRRQTDPWEEALPDWVANREPFRTSEALTHLGVEMKNQHRGLSMRVAKILRSLGYKSVSSAALGGRRWIPNAQLSGYDWDENASLGVKDE